MFSYSKLLAASVFIAASLLVVVASASAQTVTHAYETDVRVQRGMIVRISGQNSAKVELLKPEDISKMEGVVVAANDAPVTISPAVTNSQQVYVATAGRYNVLVSDQAGPIEKGDYITISSLAGVGMKAGREQPLIVGKSLGSFDGKSNLSGKTTVKDSEGADVPIAIGMIAAEINISHNPLEATAESILPGYEYLQRMATDIAGKPVPPLRLYIGIIVLLLTATIAGSIIYAGVRASLVAIGRNPLAKSSIARKMIQVILTGMIILIIGVIGVYLILKL